MANNQTINVGIKFNADTSAAKQSIKDLETTLSKLGQTDIGFSGGSIDHAVQSVRQLETALKSAVNVKTGKLDFSKLNTSLKAMGTDVTTVSARLISMGPEGQKAFSQLGDAIATAELPAKRLNGVLTKFGDTLIRTIRWQVASSMIHGFMSTVSSAVGYIENLDKSLNSIQIVTQKNGDEMAKFAKQANVLAGELSAVTKEYTDASLIFFQQGLDTDEVIERTNATIKLAKVTGESVEQISSQLTAIWNNFDDGTKNLEYYADVITALGAATASSSDEISQGLSKFAAVADTVGLSYERATAALATVVAETRQSADIVGTSFRTIFARIEGLSLGETLEDGVTLNKYSEALAKVGVNILNQEGELKSMDNILDNIARRWENLSQAQKVALSQTVAGVRQYSQFLALMENYDKVRANEEIARDSEGTLEKQFDVYQDSIEALNTELKKAKQDVFDSLLDDEQIKGYKQLLIDVLGFLKNVSESFGGIKGIIGVIGSMLLANYLPQIEARIGNIFANIKDGLGFTQLYQDKALASQQAMAKKLGEGYNGNIVESSSESLRGHLQERMLELRRQINQESQNYTETQRQQMEFQLQELEKLQSKVIIDKEELEILKQQTTELQRREAIRERYLAGRAERAVRSSEEYQSRVDSAESYSKLGTKLQGSIDEIISAGIDKSGRLNVKKLNGTGASQFTKAYEDAERELQQLTEKQGSLNNAERQRKKELEEQLMLLKEQLAIIEAIKQQKLSTSEFKNKVNELVGSRVQAIQEDQQSILHANEQAILEARQNATGQTFTPGSHTGSMVDALSTEFGANGDFTQILTNLQGVKEYLEDAGVKAKVLSENGEITSKHYDDVMDHLRISRENMEALGKTSGKFEATSIKTQAIMKNITGYTTLQAVQSEDQDKNSQAYLKRQQEIAREQKVITEQAKQLSESLKDDPNQSRVLSKEIQAVDDAIASGKFEQLNIALGELQQKANQGAEATRHLARAMAEDLASGDANVQSALERILGSDIDIERKAELLKQVIEDVKKAQEKLAEGPDKDPWGKFTQRFNDVARGFTQLAAGARMTSSGFNQLTDSIAKGSGFIQGFSGAAMALSGVLMTVTSTNKLLTGLIGKAYTDAIKKATAAAIAHKAAMGVVGIALAAVAVVITAIVSAHKKEAEARKEAAEAAKKQAEEAKKQAETSKEELKTVEELAKSQKELYDEYIKTGSGKSDLYDATKHLLEELGREDLMLDLLAGKYEKINEELEKTIALKRKDAAISAGKSAEEAEEAYQSELAASENGLVLNSEGNVEFLSSKDANVRDYLIRSLGINDYGISNEKLQEELQKIYGDNLIFNGTSLSYKNTQAGFEAYKKFQEESAKQYKEILGKEKEKDSAKKQFYDYVNSILPEGEGLEFGENFDVLMLMNLLEDKEGYDANTFSHYYDAYFGKEIEEDVYKGVRNRFSQNTDSEAYKLGEASAEEYSNAVNAGFNSYLEDSGILKAESVEEIFDIINANIGQNGEIVDSSPFVNYLSEIMGVETDAAKEYIEKFLPNLYNLMLGANKDLAELTFVKDKRKDIDFAKAAESAEISEKDMNSLLVEANIDFNTISSTEDLADLLNLLQEQADNEPIEIKANLAKEASKGWKKNMEYLDMKDWLDKYSSLFTEEELNNFLNSSYEQQTAILDRMFSPEAFQKASADRIAQLQEYQNQWKQGLYNDGKGAKPISIQDYLKNATGIETDSDILNMIQNGFEVPDDRRGKFAFAQKLLDENGITIEQYQQLVEIYNQLTSAIDGYDTELKELEEDQGLLDELGPATAFNAKVNALGLDRDEISDIEKEIPNLVDQYDDLAESLKTDADAAREVALAIKQTDKGLDDLVKNYDDWKEVLSGKDDVKKIEAMKDLKKSLADIMNITDELQEAGMTLGDHFGDYLLEHMDLVKKAADGDKDAIFELQKVAAEDILLQIKTDLNIKPEEYDELKNKVLGTMQDIQSMLDNNELQIGAIEDGPLMASLNNIINSVAMTSDQAQALLATMGFDAEVETAPQKKVASYYRYPTFRPEPIEAGGDTIGYNLVEDQDSGGWQKVEGFEETTALKIKTAKYVGGGNIVTRSGGTGRYSNSGKSGGGGGGGSRSKKEPKKANDEIERYHVIDKTIDSLSKKYSRLSAAKDAAFGAQRLKYIERENKLLQEQYEAEKQRLKEVEDYYAKDRGAIEAYGAVIDENGVISNYEQIIQAQLDKYNAAVASYNAGSMTDEAFEVIEKEYEEFKKVLSQFEETNSEWLEQLQKVEDAIREQIATELDAIKVKIEVKLELPNEQLKIIEFKLKTLEDRAFVTSERLALFGEQAQLAADSFETYADAFKKVLTMEVTDAEGNKTGGFGLTEDQANRLLGGDLSVIEEAGITGENAQAIMDALKEYEDNLIDEYNKLADARKQMWEELNNMIDEYSEAIDNQIDRMEKLGNIAKNIKTLIGTLGKETMGVTADIMDSINESILSSSRSQIEALGSSIAAWETSLAEAKDKLAQAIAENDQDAIDEWNKVIQTLEDKIIDGKERMLSQINDFVEQAAEILQEQVKESFDNLARQMYGMTMDDAIASYDRYKTLSEDYLKDYQKIYELSKLTRNIENSINNTDNIRAKERLRDLQEEINKYQAEGVKMTQYEVDYLTKKYELRQAEIALEEAQNAKEQVRLSRNADGGWGYVYTANQENIDQAQQNYEDKLYALQQLNQQAIEDSQSTILQLQKEFEDQILEIISDTSLTEEERQAKIEELQQYYLARQQVYYDTLDSALAHNQELYRQDWTEYNRLTGYRISADNDYVDNFNETWMGTNGIGAGIESVQRAFEVYQTTLGKYDDGEGQTVLGSTYTRISNYVTAVRNILASLGTALDGEEGGPSVGQSIADEIGKINTALGNASTAVQDLITELETNLPSAMTALANVIGGKNGIDNTLNNMQGIIENINGAVQGLITSLTNLGNIDASPTINNPVPSAGNAGSGSALGQGNGGNGGDRSPGGPGGVSNTSEEIDKSEWRYDKNEHWHQVYEEPGHKLLNKRADKAAHSFKWVKDEEDKRIEIEKCRICGYIRSRRYNSVIIETSFDTGGYTGSFGPDSRMAMLHEKELVLNKQDTQNVLQMVAMAREALGQPVNLPLSSIGAIKANFKNQNGSGLGLQEVHIEAHFPNAINHLEIEEALRNLANYTAQNAYNFDFSNRVNIF